MRSGPHGAVTASKQELRLLRPGCVDYVSTMEAMREFTHARTPETVDEMWLVEHPPVYTQGQAGKAEHVLAPGTIPVVPSDRGGQVTYHGPGQLVGYLLFDIRRLGVSVRELVSGIEQTVIALLQDYGIDARARRDAPGVYVGGCKIAALGLRIRKGYTYHGLSLNVDMDLTPFSGINPCGYEGLGVTSLAELGVNEDLSSVGTGLVNHVITHFGYDSASIKQER